MNSSACGTWAREDLLPICGVHAQEPAATGVEIAIDLAHVGLGHADLTSMIGSSRMGFDSAMPLRVAWEPASRNESSSESTL